MLIYILPLTNRPIKDCSYGTPVTRNYLPFTFPSATFRSYRLLAFVDEEHLIQRHKETMALTLLQPQSISSSMPGEFCDIPPSPPLLDTTPSLWIDIFNKLATFSSSSSSNPASALASTEPSSNNKDKLLVYCDKPLHLCPDFVHPEGKFRVTNSDFEAADILYLIEHTLDGQDGGGGDGEGEGEGGIIQSEGDELNKKGKITNQFCWEGMLVSKEHFVRTATVAHQYSIRQQGKTITKFQQPAWLPSSYDLSDEKQLIAFVNNHIAYMEALTASSSSSSTALTNNDTGNDNDNDNDKDNGNDNVYILKKYRGRQSIDYPITSSLSCALRHLESAPRLASKYVSQPALYQGRKFDLRFYIIVHSLSPLKVYRYDPLFIVRCANGQYESGSWETYQKHFTLMSLLDDEDYGPIRGSGVRQDPTMHELIKWFDEYYYVNDNNDRRDDKIKPKWNTHVQPAIDKAIKAVFSSVEKIFPLEPPHPSGQTLHPNSCWSLNQPNACPARAMYGVDVILTQDLQPKILEVQFGPDCQAAIGFHRYFWDDILSSVFLDDLSKCVPL